MQAELVKTFRFEAAHSLPNVPADHKCNRMHGHSYRVDVHVSGQPDPKSGWVVDFGEIKSVVEAVLDKLDHRTLNEIPGLENSTSEMLGQYLWGKIAPALPALSAITIWESDTSRCTITDA
ncbi:MAG: 6-carboxytetrahydropterin synthase QueD [bacterium]|nr:6-carboxytetrahydropterin synthase QueD [bacterium]